MWPAQLSSLVLAQRRTHVACSRQLEPQQSRSSRLRTQRVWLAPLLKGKAQQVYTNAVSASLPGGKRGTVRAMNPSFFPSLRARLLAGLTVASLLAPIAGAQVATPTPDSTPAQAAGAESPANSAPAGATSPNRDPAQADSTLTALPPNNTKRIKEKTPKKERAVQTKDTRKALTREKKLDPIATQDAKLPDRQLYEKALLQTKKGHFDVARLELQNLLATYPDSQYQMRAKLAIADSWYKEGGSAALAQAEAEYSDFRVFFPNAPEAAEAQMRIGDIYFRQMDKPDRDYSKAVHAEEEYRRMLTDYPESKLIPQAKQRLREVQELLATREASIGDFYTTRADWPAAIARYKTVMDTYPLYSHMDDVLIGMGDSYEAESRAARMQNLPEAAKAKLVQDFDGKAAAAYRAVVLEHSASPHVEDARDRLDSMHLPIPVPTAEEVASSQALENSRSSYRLQDRARLLFFHQPDVVAAARIGEPPLTDPKATMAPTVTREIVADFNEALHPGTTKAAAPAVTADATSDAGAPGSTPAANSAAPLSLQEVPNADGSTTDTTGTVTGTASGTAGTPTNSMGVEIVSPGTTDATGSRMTPTGNGLNAVGPATNNALPPVEKAPDSPDQVNDIAPGAAQPAAQAPPEKGKVKSPSYDKDEESSSKHKKKKGVDKLNPF